MSSSVEVQLVRVVISDRRHQQTIHLRERDGERQFSILIGINEAEEIHRKLRGYKPMRPMTHDLVVQLLEVCGGVIERIVVNTVPIPAAAWLFASALGGLVVVKRKRA